MSVTTMKLRKATMTGLALAALGLSLAGCVVYPTGGYAYNSYGGGYGYAPSYYAPPPVYGSVIIGGGGWGGGGWRGGDGDGDRGGWGGRHWR